MKKNLYLALRENEKFSQKLIDWAKKYPAMIVIAGLKILWTEIIESVMVEN